MDLYVPSWDLVLTGNCLMMMMMQCSASTDMSAVCKPVPYQRRWHFTALSLTSVTSGHCLMHSLMFQNAFTTPPTQKCVSIHQEPQQVHEDILADVYQASAYCDPASL